MTGNFYPKNWSSASKSRLAAETIFLLGLGGLAVVLHVYLRLPLKLNGRHGIELIALMLLGRLSVNRRWSASITSIGASSVSLLPVWHFTDPLTAITFLAPGPIIDLTFSLTKGMRPSLWFLVAVGGVAFTSQPILRYLGTVMAGFQYDSLNQGLLYSTMTHFMFGAIGGLLAYLYVLGSDYRKRATLSGD